MSATRTAISWLSKRETLPRWLLVLRRKAWVAGAVAHRDGEPFAANPDAPPPNYTNAAWEKTQRVRGLAWSQGWWWASKYRPKNRAAIAA